MNRDGGDPYRLFFIAETVDTGIELFKSLNLTGFVSELERHCHSFMIASKSKAKINGSRIVWLGGWMLGVKTWFPFSIISRAQVLIS